MISRDQLSQYLTDFLAINTIKDYCVNGLQVQGNDFIKKIVTAVTASKGAIEYAIKNNAEALIVHHGYCWTNDNPAIVGMQHARISKLMQSNLNLFAYHLPLDLHRHIGNNVILAKKIGLLGHTFHETLKTKDLLCFGNFAEPLTIKQLSKNLTHLLEHNSLYIALDDTKSVCRIALCTGAAADAVFDAKNLGAEVFITGEISERTYYQALELDIAVFAAGHHATEKFGVQALGEHLADKFALQHDFYDSFNPI